MMSWQQKVSMETRIPTNAVPPVIRNVYNHHRSGVLSCEFHKSGRFVLSSSSGGEIHIASTSHPFKKLLCLTGHMGAVTEVHYSKDFNSIFSSSTDQTVVGWDIITASQKSCMTGHISAVNTVDCSRKESNIVCSGSSDKTIKIWDTRQRHSSTTFKSHHGVSSACFSDCAKYVFSSGFDDGDIECWDVRQNSIVHLFSGHEAAVTGLSVSPSGNHLASCSIDGTLRTWDITVLEEAKDKTRTFRLGPKDVVRPRRCAWSNFDRMVSAGTMCNTVVVFNAFTGKVLMEHFGHRDAVTDVAFHPTTRAVMSAGLDKYLILQNID